MNKKTRRTYKPWDNDRVDKYLKELPLKRLTDVDRWNDKIKIYCIECDTIFYVTPNNLVNLGVGCPTCRKNKQQGKRRKVKYSYTEVKKILLEYGWELLDDEYYNYASKMKLKCTNCGNEIERSFSVINLGFNECLVCKGIKDN